MICFVEGRFVPPSKASKLLGAIPVACATSLRRKPMISRMERSASAISREGTRGMLSGSVPVGNVMTLLQLGVGIGLGLSFFRSSYDRKMRNLYDALSDIKDRVYPSNGQTPSSYKFGVVRLSRDCDVVKQRLLRFSNCCQLVALILGSANAAFLIRHAVFIEMDRVSANYAGLVSLLSIVSYAILLCFIELVLFLDTYTLSDRLSKFQQDVMDGRDGGPY